MAGYAPLFTILVEHEFFGRESGADFKFVPSAASGDWMRRMGILWRSGGRSLHAFYDEDRRAAIRLEAEESGPLSLVFKVSAVDRSFASYTVPLVQRDDAILYFEGRGRAGTGGTTERLLHDGDFAGEGDFKDIRELARIPGVLEPRDRVVHPDFIVAVPLQKDDAALAGDGILPSAITYRVRFSARDTIWKYYLLGYKRKDVPSIADAGRRMEFEFVGRTVLPGGKTALTFRSKTPIPLRDRYEHRFQLKDMSVAGGKVLIRRLPVASTGNLGKDVIDGRETIVSEIYINC